MYASIMNKILGSGAPNTVVLSKIENLEEFEEDVRSNIKHEVMNLLPCNNPSDKPLKAHLKKLTTLLVI